MRIERLIYRRELVLMLLAKRHTSMHLLLIATYAVLVDIQTLQGSVCLNDSILSDLVQRRSLSILHSITSMHHSFMPDIIIFIIEFQVTLYVGTSEIPSRVLEFSYLLHIRV